MVEGFLNLDMRTCIMLYVNENFGYYVKFVNDVVVLGVREVRLVVFNKG